uniref:GB1/RHD3-type G domain-containing protein n=1 Tax=Latimeria chalumnae TaxID=7897 RepID=H2ZS93_LATCH
GMTESIRECNFRRECIRDFFPYRKCFTFPRPIDSKNLKHLDKIPDNELIKDFVEVSKKFCNYIYDSAKPKRVQGAVLNGRLFATLLETFVEFIHNGQAPCLESAVTQMAQIENSKAVEEAVQCYQESMEKLVKFPMGSDELSKHHIHSEKKAYDTFRTRSFKDEKKSYMKRLLQSDLESSYKQYRSKNKRKSEVFCRDLLRKLFQLVEKKVEQNAYQRPGGFREYTLDQELVEKQYLSTPGKGVEASNVLFEFKGKKETEMKLILQNNLAEKEKEITGKCAEVQHTRVLCRVYTKILEFSIEKQLEDEKRSNKENIEKLLQKMEEERMRMMHENKLLLEQKLHNIEKKIDSLKKEES